MASFKLSGKEKSLWYSALTNEKRSNFSEISARERGQALVKEKKKNELSQLNCIFELIRHRPSVLTMRSSGFVVDSDDDSVNSLNLFADDTYEEKRGGMELSDVFYDSTSSFRMERWNRLHDSSSSLRLQGSSRDLLSPLNRSLASMRSIYTSDDTPALITPLDFDSSMNRSLTAYLFDKPSGNISSRTPNPKEQKFRQINNREIGSSSKQRPNVERNGSNMSLFDYSFSDLDLSGFEE